MEEERIGKDWRKRGGRTDGGKEGRRGKAGNLTSWPARVRGHQEKREYYFCRVFFITSRGY